MMATTPNTQPARPSLTQQIAALARELGFALAGICPARPTEHETFIRHWLAEGRHGEMDYLARHLEQRLDPERLLPGARSVICVADRYPPDPPASTRTDKPVGRFARYAWGRDYHKVIRKRLHRMADALTAEHPGHHFRSTVDTAPMLEREHAKRAGLGWIGKHTLLIHPQQGSWLLLGTIVTTLPVDSEPAPDVITDHCGSCTRCIDACPTDCITPYALDAKRCISYLTLEHRSLIDADLHEAMGDWVGGCDICQEICPHNRTQRPSPPAASPEDYQPRRVAEGLDLLDMLGWSSLDRQQTFEGSALKRIRLDMLKRNALIAAGNYLRDRSHPALAQRIAELADDLSEPELVRLTARQVLKHLQQTRSGDV